MRVHDPPLCHCRHICDEGVLRVTGGEAQPAAAHAGQAIAFRVQGTLGERAGSARRAVLQEGGGGAGGWGSRRRWHGSAGALGVPAGLPAGALRLPPRPGFHANRRPSLPCCALCSPAAQIATCLRGCWRCGCPTWDSTSTQSKCCRAALLAAGICMHACCARQSGTLGMQAWQSALHRSGHHGSHAPFPPDWSAAQERGPV